MKDMGIPVYLDETPILNLHDSPYWFCGVLNLNGANENFIRFDYTFNDPLGSGKLKQQFRLIHERLKKDGGGFVSILFHLHTAINTEYWDAVNFADGKNTPKGNYILPVRHPAEVTKRAWKDFEKLLTFIASYDDVKFITATDALKILRRKDKLTFGVYEIEKISSYINSTRKLSFQVIDGELISPAHAFAAVTNFVADYSRKKSIPKKLTVVEPLGPLTTIESGSEKTLSISALLVAVRDTSKFLRDHGYIPSSIGIGNSDLAPADFLATLSILIPSITSGKKLELDIQIRRARLDDGFVNEQAFNDALKWKLFPRNFRAPKILEQIKLQCWTLVPAKVR
jgi:hypothetical protein